MNTTQNKIETALKGRTSVADAISLPDLFALVGGDLAEFKAACVELYESGKIRLEDYTRAWADVIGRPEAIEYKIDMARGYGLKWFVRAM